MMSGDSPQGVAEVIAAYPKSAPVAAQLVALATKLNVRPAWIANVINFETGGTWNPAIVNSASGATGLIQFIEPTAKELGTSLTALRMMTAAQQFVYAEKYFLLPRIPKPLTSQIDVFMAVFYPAAIGKGANWVIGSERGAAYVAKIQAQNPGIKTAADYAAFATKHAKMA